MFNKYYWLCLGNCFEIPKTRFSNCKIGNFLSLFKDRTDTLCLNFRLKLAISFLLYCLFMTENGRRSHFERRLWNSQKLKYRKVQVYDIGNHCCKRVVSLRQAKLQGRLEMDRLLQQTYTFFGFCVWVYICDKHFGFFG